MESWDTYDSELVPTMTTIVFGAWNAPFVFYAACKSSGEVYAIEPDGVAVAALQRALRTNAGLERVHVFHGAIGETNALVSVDAVNPTPTSVSNELRVQVRLDGFVRRRLIRGPLFLKIDCEGRETALLPALRSLVKTWRDSGERLVLYLRTYPESMAASEQSEIRMFLDWVGEYSVVGHKSDRYVIRPT